MANNVFGTPITTTTLGAMPEYRGKRIGSIEMAQEALKRKYDDSKFLTACQFAESLKDRCKSGVSTECLIYNATGDTVRFINGHHWCGRWELSSCPMEIANGQWGAFLHAKNPAEVTGSTAAVIYRGGKNAKGVECDWMLSWCHPSNTSGLDNSVYTGIREAQHYETDHWDYIRCLLSKSGGSHIEQWQGCLFSATTEEDSSLKIVAFMTLKTA